ncbi:PIN domain-like protein [Sparassis latifolia]
MGVNGLWELLKPAREETSLKLLALCDGFEGCPGEWLYRLGIDTSIWFHQLQERFAAGHANSGENPELRSLFHHLARLLKLPVRPLFVFDGPGRPAHKCSCKVIGTHWMVGNTQKLLDAFGYEWRVAPGEAEAELAKLNQLGIVDAVLTDDSDALIFGARTVIRNYKADAEDEVHAFRQCTINAHSVISLSRGGLVLVALLCGGDYDENGLRRCRPQTALAIMHYGLGESLCDAAVVLGNNETELSAFLSGWRDRLRSILSTDPDNHLGRRHIALSNSVPDSFPDVAVLRAYLSPSTSANISHLPAHPLPVDLAKLGTFCELHFGWGTKSGIVKHVREWLWPGMALKLLVAEAVAYDRRHQKQGAHSTLAAPPLEVWLQPDHSTDQDNVRVIAIDRSSADIAISNLFGVRLSPHLSGTQQPNYNPSTFSDVINLTASDDDDDDVEQQEVISLITDDPVVIDLTIDDN